MKKSQLKKIIREEIFRHTSDDLTSLRNVVDEEENAYKIAVTIANNIDKYDVSATSLGTAIAYILKEKYGKQHSKSLIDAIQKELNKVYPPTDDPDELEWEEFNA